MKYSDKYIDIFFITVMAFGLLLNSDCPAKKKKKIDPDAGILIKPDQEAAITIAGDCRIVTNHIPETTIFIRTVDTDQWPDLELLDEKGEQLIEVEPCRDI